MRNSRGHEYGIKLCSHPLVTVDRSRVLVSLVEMVVVLGRLFHSLSKLSIGLLSAPSFGKDD